ncbi:MAG: hypothetical protein LBT81_03235 [Helicobacteraceae bacterium]|jgi:three-Cys-motif partner protein|nr:hypothetical protein [Helicobacteraceae bacterium]
MFKIVKNDVSKSTSNIRNLIFIDPYGYKNIKKEITDDLTDNKKTEIILFLPISHIYRFSKAAIAYENSARFQALQILSTALFRARTDKNSKRRHNRLYPNITDAPKQQGCFAVSCYIERNAVNKFALSL